jgi:hypothetical protein
VRRDLRLLDRDLDVGLLAAGRRRQGSRELDSLHDHRLRGDGARGALSTVYGMFILSRIPKITQTMGFDPRFTADRSASTWKQSPSG